jgi:predicted regulator of Ras-like GTPase activity (Roadblock/LC7/MglB family)
MAKHEALKNSIEVLRKALPELKGVLLASSEGLPIAHSISNGADPNGVAALATAASNLGRRISSSTSVGALEEVAIRAEGGWLFVYAAGTRANLAVLAEQDANAGLVHLEARAAAAEIAELFDTPARDRATAQPALSESSRLVA